MHEINDEQELLGKTVKSIDVDGFGVFIIFTDGTEFEYSVSDGGYSRYSIYAPKEGAEG